MKELIDLDSLFDKKLAEFMQENAGKYTEKQWESIIPKLYKSFGDTFVKKLGNTPRGYFAEMADEELVTLLARYVEEDVPVPDFLCNELESRNCPDALLTLLKRGNDALLTLAVNLAGGNPKAFGAYFELLSGELDSEIKDAIVDQLKSGADAAKVQALACYEAGVEKELMLEILSRTKERDDRILDILLKEFRTSEDDLPMHASYLAAYGDERALPVLLDFIDRDEINYLEYQELKYAIEALGGEYTRPRDFSGDPYYQEIVSQSQMPAPEKNEVN